MIYASPGRRFLGFFLDFVVLGLVAVLLVPIMGVSIDDILDGNPAPGFTFANLVVTAIYQIGFITWRGQTPGKIAVRIKVVDEETGALPVFTAAGARWLIPAAAQFVPGFGIFVLVVIYGWLIWDPRRQGIHDKVGRTVVVDQLLPVPPPTEDHAWEDEEPPRPPL